MVRRGRRIANPGGPWTAAASWLALATRARAQTRGLSFLAVGDWGRAGERGQRDVAAGMGATAAELDSRFVLSAGDNFYPAGVRQAGERQVGQARPAAGVRGAAAAAPGRAPAERRAGSNLTAWLLARQGTARSSRTVPMGGASALFRRGLGRFRLHTGGVDRPRLAMARGLHVRSRR